MYNLQVCACLSMSEGGWIINVCSSQHHSVHVSGKGNKRTFYILQVTSYFSDPGVRNLILSKLGKLCFSLNGILAVINPLPRCVLPEEGMCNQQDWCAGFWMNYVQLPWCGRRCWANSLCKARRGAIPRAEGLHREGSVCLYCLAGERRHGQVRWLAKDAVLQRCSELFSGTTWGCHTVWFISDT